MNKGIVKVLWGVFMVIIYLGMGLLLLLSDVFNINQVLKIIIGVLFIIYGLFRGYRVLKMND